MCDSTWYGRDTSHYYYVPALCHRLRLPRPQTADLRRLSPAPLSSNLWELPTHPVSLATPSPPVLSTITVLDPLCTLSPSPT